MNQRKLEELFHYTFNMDDAEWYNKGEMEKILRGIPPEVLKEIIRFLNIYRIEIINNTFKAYPMNIDALNCRNGSVTVLGDIISVMTGYTQPKVDPEFRDRGELRAKLNDLNSNLQQGLSQQQTEGL